MTDKPADGSPASDAARRRAENFEHERQKVEPYRPHYDVRQAGRIYATTAGTLAGFAFTVIVLLMTRAHPNCKVLPSDPLCGDLSALRGRAVAALFVAFFGCVVGAFLLATVAAEEAHAVRTRAMAVFGGAGFGVAVVLVFWGLALLAALFKSTVGQDIVVAADGALMAIVVLAVAFLAFPIVDVKTGFAPEEPTVSARDYLHAFWPSAVVLIPAIIVRLASGGQASRAWVQNDATGFAIILVACGILILVSAGVELWASGWEHDADKVELPSLIRWWIAIHSAAFAALILTLPS